MTDKPRKHTGSDSTSPYPVSSLSPSFELVDLAKQISEADAMINTRVSAKLRVIADQIRALQAEAKMAVFDFIEAWYNPHRRHSGLGQLSPFNYERKHQKAA